MKFICDFCGKSLSNKFNLNNHERICKKNKDRAIIVCELEGCNLEFSRPNALAMHQKKCKRLTPDERTGLRGLVLQTREVNASVKKKLRDKSSNWVREVAVRNGNGAPKLVEKLDDLPKLLLTETPQSGKRVLVTFSIGEDKLNDLLTQLLSSVQLEQIARQ